MADSAGHRRRRGDDHGSLPLFSDDDDDDDNDNDNDVADAQQQCGAAEQSPPALRRQCTSQLPQAISLAAVAIAAVWPTASYCQVC